MFMAKLNLTVQMPQNLLKMTTNSHITDRFMISGSPWNNNIQNILSAIYYTLGIKMQEDLFDAALNKK